MNLAAISFIQVYSCFTFFVKCIFYHDTIFFSFSIIPLTFHYSLCMYDSNKATSIVEFSRYLFDNPLFSTFLICFKSVSNGLHLNWCIWTLSFSRSHNSRHTESNGYNSCHASSILFYVYWLNYSFLYFLIFTCFYQVAINFMFPHIFGFFFEQ